MNKIGATSVIVIPPLQFGQVSIIGNMECARLALMMFPFAQQFSERENKFTLVRVSVSLKGRS